jgi:malate dehydrogenase
MKVSVIGAGNVGASTCYLLIAKEICESVVLLDINRSIAAGKAIDMMQASIALISRTKIKTTSDYADIEGSDIVVITAGMPRKDGMSREDLLNVNLKIMEDVIQNVKTYAPNCIIIVVSNPLDVMTYAALKMSGFNRNRVIGMGGILDSARMAHSIVKKLENKDQLILATVIGTHGEGMIPLVSNSFVGSTPVAEIFDEATLAQIVDETKKGGAKIVGYLQTSAYYAPAASICILIETILYNRRTTHPCSVLLNGEYGASGVCIGVPVKIWREGVLGIEQLELSDDEKAEFKSSVEGLRGSLAVVESYLAAKNSN